MARPAGLFISQKHQSKGENMENLPPSTPASTPPRHFTVQSLAAYWGVSPSHIYNLVHSNALRHMRIGSSIRIPAIIVKEFEEAACQLTRRNIVSGSIATEQSMSSGQTQTQQPKQGCRQNAFQQGQRIGLPPKNTERSS
jgi:excisionase family DNA binding protein